MNKEEILEAIQDDKMMPFIQPEQLAGIVDFVIKNYKPSLPSDLDEAAIQFTVKRSQLDSGSVWCTGDIGAAFKAGAEWMAGQGISYDTTISADKTIPVLPMKDVSNMGLDYGDNVTVQIRKK